MFTLITFSVLMLAILLFFVNIYFTFRTVCANITNMNIQDLESIGLSPQQAQAYSYVVCRSTTKPAEMARALQLTRTNAYKILDSLVELRIVRKNDKATTLTYSAENPVALATLTAKYRAEAMAREEKTNSIMKDLLATFSKHTNKPGVEIFVGKQEVADAYRKQANLKEDVLFIHTKSDVPMMGYDIMHELRMLPSRHERERNAIMAFPDNGVTNQNLHDNSNLKVHWIASGKYSEPVEWSATESSLLIATYAQEPQAVLIMDPVIAAAFTQLWRLLSQNLEIT